MSTPCAAGCWALLTGALLGPSAVALPARAEAPLIEVWTLPSCPCCHGWFAHLKDNGFNVRIHDDGNNDAGARLGVPDQYGSCHTGLVGGFAIEGHVPARELHRLLKERPEAIGLAVPTMPIGGRPGLSRVERTVRGAIDQARRQRQRVRVLRIGSPGPRSFWRSARANIHGSWALAGKHSRKDRGSVRIGARRPCPRPR